MIKPTAIDKAIIEAYPVPQKKTEAAAIRSLLRLRKSSIKRKSGFPIYTVIFEVSTTIHGTEVFKWFTISEDTFEWYKKNFPEIPIEISNATN